MANTFWEKDFLILIMCSYMSQSAACFMHSGFLLHIINNYALQMLCGSPHNICNEEGKLNGEPLNRALRDEDGHIYDIVAGTFLIAGLSEDNFCSLSQAHIEQFTQEFKAPEMFARANGKILIMPMNWETVKDERPSVAEKLNVSARHNKQKQHSKSGEMEL